MHTASTELARVAVVITTYNHADFLEEAIASVEAQTRQVQDIVVVDDGSSDSPDRVTARHPAVRLLSQPNSGLSAARNAGLRAVTADYVVFLDADDRLLPAAVASGLACFAQEPDAVFVFGAHRMIDATGQHLTPTIYNAASSDPYRALLGLNTIGMHATVLYRRDVLAESGGFDEGLRRCEDYDVYLRLARSGRIASHPDLVAEYRWHGRNMSLDRRTMLRVALAVQHRHRAASAHLGLTAAEWRRLRRGWIDWYTSEELKMVAATGSRWRALVAAGRLSPRWVLSHKVAGLQRRALRTLPWRLARMLPGNPHPPPVGRVDFGDFGTPTPISWDFGHDRGLPVDRIFVEHFLQRHAKDIAGTVLEVGSDEYSRRFGDGHVSEQHVLDIDASNSRATIVGDLTSPDTLPPSSFDCIVLTQTLHMMFDLKAAVDNLWRALKPGGVLLVTAPGITQVDRYSFKECWYWALTSQSMRRLFAAQFGPERIEVEAFGNVYAATAFLQGLASSEVDRALLDVRDEAYPVIVTCRAVRAAS